MSEYRLIPLSGKAGEGLFAKVSLEDFERVAAFRWYLHRTLSPDTFYVCTNEYAGGKPRKIYLHRFVMDAAPGTFIDHINCDGFDCRRENLRFVTRAQNAKNRRSSAKSTSSYLGVFWLKKFNRWVAKIVVKKGEKVIYLGRFTDEKAAARAYNKAALKYHGEYARLNEV